MALHLIYYFQSSQNQNESWTPARYKVVHFFGEEGFVPEEKLRDLAKADPNAWPVDGSDQVKAIQGLLRELRLLA